MINSATVQPVPWDALYRDVWCGAPVVIMKLDANLLRYLTKVEWRVLEAVEMGMKNHELVPVPLIGRIANLRRTGIATVLGNLLKHKLLAHDRQVYDGYKLTYLGYDFLALRAFVARSHLVGVGMRMGVGKESDIHICEGADGRIIILKLHRLGRVSFRSIKRNRDYLGHRQNASWMYMARLAAAKEFAYMKALHEHGFPVPEPIDVNRHGILMQYIDAYPLSQVRELRHPCQVLEHLMALIVRMAESGLIHGDFNEFNLMVSDKEEIIMIDFPQIVSTHHPNAQTYFDRDVECIRALFKSRFGIEVTRYPKFPDMKIPDVGPETSPLFRGALPGDDTEERLQEALMIHKSKLDRRLRKLNGEEKGDVISDEASDEDHQCVEGRVSEESADCKTFVDVRVCKDNETSSASSEDESGLESNDESIDRSNDDDSHHVEEQPAKRLDNVWRPTVKRQTADSARKNCAAVEKKKRKYFKGNGGAKRSRDGRKIRESMAHDW